MSKEQKQQLESVSQQLQSTINEINIPGKGILAADGNIQKCTQRMKAVGIESTPENRLDYRETLFTTPEIEKFVSGVILHEETLYQVTSDGTPIPILLIKKGVVPGIKVDLGLTDLERTKGEKVTKGLVGLKERLVNYKKQGARFAKWKAAFAVSDILPSKTAIIENAKRLAEYAKTCQELGIVPIVEPEVLMDGTHSINRCQEVTTTVQKTVFQELKNKNVNLQYIILKPNMVISGKDADKRAAIEEVASKTVSTFKETVPSEVPTINFLSGGQSPEEATAHLNVMNKIKNLPWTLSFSYGRALQQPALAIWATKDKKAAQEIFHKRLKLNSLAVKAEYTKDMEE